MACSKLVAAQMKYHGYEHIHEPDKILNIFDGTHYAGLCGKRVVIDGKELPHQYCHRHGVEATKDSKMYS